MKLLLFAQYSEAEATINLLNAKVQPGSQKQIWSEGIIPTLYTYDGGVIGLLGI